MDRYLLRKWQGGFGKEFGKGMQYLDTIPQRRKLSLFGKEGLGEILLNVSNVILKSPLAPLFQRGDISTLHRIVMLVSFSLYVGLYKIFYNITSKKFWTLCYVT
jgi:hypothetical protein